MGAGKPIADDRRAAGASGSSARGARPSALRGRYLELRYEDLVADPEPALRRVCELIELDFDPAMLELPRARRRAARRARRPGPGRGARGPPGSRARRRARADHRSRRATPGSGAWRTEMSPADRGAFEAVAGDLLRDLGYDLLS